MSWVVWFFIILISVVCLGWPWVKRIHNRSLPITLVLLVSVLMSAGLMYRGLGAFDEVNFYYRLSKEGLTLGQIVQAKLSPKEQVFRLQKHLALQPKNHEGWHLLGQALVQLGEFGLANKAFERSMRLQPEAFDVLLVDYAESLYLANQGFTPKVHELLKEAHRLSTKNPKVDALYGFDAFHRKDYAAAKAYWQKAIAASPPNAQLTKSLTEAISHVDKLTKQTSG